MPGGEIDLPSKNRTRHGEGVLLPDDLLNGQGGWIKPVDAGGDEPIDPSVRAVLEPEIEGITGYSGKSGAHDYASPT